MKKILNLLLTGCLVYIIVKPFCSDFSYVTYLDNGLIIFEIFLWSASVLLFLGVGWYTILSKYPPDEVKPLEDWLSLARDAFKATNERSIIITGLKSLLYLFAVIITGFISKDLSLVWALIVSRFSVFLYEKQVKKFLKSQGRSNTIN
jgi:hypothetical protein